MMRDSKMKIAFDAKETHRRRILVHCGIVKEQVGLESLKQLWEQKCQISYRELRTTFNGETEDNNSSAITILILCS